MKHAYSLALTGARDMIPLLVAAAPFGTVYGALAISQGMSEWLVMAMSLFVFAGASQFIAVTLLASSALFPVIVTTVFVVNLRHMLYSASLMPYLENVPQWLRAPMAFWLTDESYAVVSRYLLSKPKTADFIAYYLGSSLAMYINWAFFSWLGMTLGQTIPNIENWGLEVAMIVAFVGIVVPAMKTHADWACASTAVISALLTYDWPHQTGLLFSSVVAITVALIVSRKQKSNIDE
ncbi:MAG: AzlC family ABC transporter permease [Cocleimonas sp.]